MGGRYESEKKINYFWVKRFLGWKGKRRDKEKVKPKKMKKIHINNNAWGFQSLGTRADPPKQSITRPNNSINICRFSSEIESLHYYGVDIRASITMYSLEKGLQSSPRFSCSTYTYILYILLRMLLSPLLIQ